MTDDVFTRLMIVATFIFSLFCALLAVYVNHVSATIFFSALFLLDGYQITRFKYDDLGAKKDE